MNVQPAPQKPKNWLLAKSRQWHIWGGLIAAAFLIVASLTGMVLNYKRPILTALGLEPSPVKQRSAGEKEPGGERTAETLAQLAVSQQQALQFARQEFGEKALERIELKREQGHWTYKVKVETGEEMWISAASGERFIKGQYEKVQRMEGGAPVKSFDWGRLLLDLHTGKIGGAFGQALMTVMAALLLWLTLSGLYVYVKPRLNRRARKSQPHSQPVVASGPALTSPTRGQA